MRLFFYECKKVFTQKSFLAILLLCAGLNLFFMNYTVNGSSVSYKPQEYRQMEKELQKMPAHKAYEQLKNSYENLEEFIFRIDEPSENELRKTCRFTGDLWKERDLLQVGMKELETVLEYESYLKKIQEDAQNMLGISIFQKNSGYSSRNLEKTAQDFQKMEGRKLSFDISEGVTCATGFLATDLLGILLLFAVCLFLILNEKQNGQLALIMHTARGRKETGAAKIGVLAVASLLIPGILYGENFIFAGFTYGFGDLNRAVQSITAYQSCILPISIGEYFLLFAAVKLLFYFAAGSMFFCICLFCRNILEIFSISLGIWSLEALACYWIPSNSSFSALKYMNLFYFLQTDKLLMRYQNVNLFSYPAGILPAAGSCILLLLLCGICFIIFQMSRNRVLMEESSNRLNRRLKKDQKKSIWGNRSFRTFFRLRSLTGFEYLKIVKRSGSLILLILFSALQLYRIQDYSYFQIPEQIYYRTYMNYLSGPITEKTRTYIDEENERYRSIFEQINDDADKNAFREELFPYTAWEKVTEEYERVTALQETSERELCLVYGDGYGQLSGNDPDMDMTSAFLVSALLILLVSGTFSCDNIHKMNQVISTTNLGRRDTLRAKKRIAYFLAIISFLLVYGADFLKIWMEIGMSHFTAPVQSLLYLSDCTFSISLFQYLILLYLVRFLGICVVLYGILAISSLCTSTIRSMLVSAILFLIPPALGLLHINAVEKVTILPLLIGNEWLNRLLSGDWDGYGAGVFILGVLICTGSEIYMRKRYAKK